MRLRGRANASSSQPHHSWREAAAACSPVIGRDFRCAQASAGRPDLAACQIDDVARARALCAASPACIALVVNQQRSWATLKRAWRWGSPPPPHLNTTYAACRAIAQHARARAACSKHSALEWRALGCGDHLAGRPLGARTIVALAAHGGRAASRLQVLTLANRRSAGLCRLLRSAVLNEVPLTVLGWEPEAQPRWQEWYLASKALMAHEFLARAELPPDAVVLVLDASDAILQLDAAELYERIRRLVSRAPHAAHFGAEAYCFSCGAKAREELRAWPGARRSASGRLFHSLNGGCVFGTPHAYRRLVQSLDALSERRAALDGGEAEAARVGELHARRSLYKAQTPPVYHTNDQAALQRLMLSPQLVAGSPPIELDYETDVCLSLFSSTPRVNLRWKNDSLISRLSDLPPAVLHFNGGCGHPRAFPSWMGVFHVNIIHVCARARARVLSVPHVDGWLF